MTVIRNNRFSILNFQYTQTYDAIKETIEAIRKRKNTKSHFLANNSEVLYNEREQTAVLVKLLAYKTKRSPKIVEDNHKWCTTVSNAYRSIILFFKTKKFVNYKLTLSVGWRKHDTCIFIEKVNGKYKFVHFNPNSYEVSNMSDLLLNKLGKSCERYGFHTNNRLGRCSAYVWQMIYKFMCFATNPYKDIELLIYDKASRRYVNNRVF